jgi:hypothetical protein
MPCLEGAGELLQVTAAGVDGVFRNPLNNQGNFASTADGGRDRLAQRHATDPVAASRRHRRQQIGC